MILTKQQKLLLQRNIIKMTLKDKKCIGPVRDRFKIQLQGINYELCNK